MEDLFNYLDKYHDQIIFSSKRGQLIADRTEKGIKLTLPKDNPEPFAEIDLFSNMLGCKALEVCRGIDDFMVLVGSENDVKDMKPDFSEISKLDSRGLIVTADGLDVDFVSRWFAPQSTIFEDPVTGSAHCSLIPYWSKELNKKKMEAIQLSARKGKLFCEDKGERVLISGKATTYFIGNIWIDQD